VVVAKGKGIGGWGKLVKGFKRYKLSIIKQVSHGDIIYSTATTVSNIVGHTLKLPREQILKFSHT